MPVVVLFVLVVGVWRGYGLMAQFQDAALVQRANLYPYMQCLEVLLLAPSIVIGGRTATKETRVLLAFD